MRRVLVIEICYAELVMDYTVLVIWWLHVQWLHFDSFKNRRQPLHMHGDLYSRVLVYLKRYFSNMKKESSWSFHTFICYEV